MTLRAALSVAILLSLIFQTSVWAGNDAVGDISSAPADDESSAGIEISIFGGVVVVPSRFRIDMETFAEPILRASTGRILFGHIKAFTKSEAHSWFYDRHVKSTRVCGLKVDEFFEEEGRLSIFLVTDNVNYLLFVDKDSTLWKKSISGLC